MQEDTVHHEPKPAPRVVQFIGWLLATELLLNGVIVATVSVVGWDGFVRRNRLIIQCAVLAIALLFGVIQAATRGISRALGPRLHPFADSAARDTRMLSMLSGIDRLEQLLITTQADAARAAAAQHDVEQARIAAASETTALQRLVAILQTVVAAEQVGRQDARLQRCHRSARGELVCTLTIGRTDGILEGAQFTVRDEQTARPIGRFRVTGLADTFAACTMIEGEGWLAGAEQFGSAELPPHTLHFALPDVARDLDAASADRILRLLTALTPSSAAPQQRPMVASSREVSR